MSGRKEKLKRRAFRDAVTWLEKRVEHDRLIWEAEERRRQQWAREVQEARAAGHDVPPSWGSSHGA